jgi:hypothetical protein
MKKERIVVGRRGRDHAAILKNTAATSSDDGRRCPAKLIDSIDQLLLLIAFYLYLAKRCNMETQQPYTYNKRSNIQCFEGPIVSPHISLFGYA